MTTRDRSVAEPRLAVNLLIGALVGLLGGLITVVALLITTPSFSDANAVAESVVESFPDHPTVPPEASVVVVPPANAVLRIVERTPRLMVVADGRSLTQALGAMPAGGVIATASSNGWWVAVSVDETNGSPIPVLLVGLLTVLTGAAAGLAIACWHARRRAIADRRNGPAGPGSTHAPPNDSSTAPERPVREVTERSRIQASRLAALVRGLAELATQLPEEYAWLVEKVLRDGGAEPFRADGQSFDPSVHHSVGTVPTADRRQINTVARTIRIGYRDDREVLVAPRVVVYADAQAPRRDSQ